MSPKMEIPAALMMLALAVLVTAGLVLALVPQLAWSHTSLDTEAHNKATIERSFDAWTEGTGGPYDLLSDKAQWTIVGRSAAARIYPSREAFLREVIRPFNARMSEPLKPRVREIYAEGDEVIVMFDATGMARDGVPYANTYSWYLKMHDDRIVSATAFFDSIAFDELWKRVTPAAANSAID